ncbi:autotransporter outer membrane beta-barrel domain-containing protein [Hymenobacter cellulosivorans]|uniref:Autotransporter outer membrane beta-barrel domain-containing protein n=1 Tax=Hymenobacter cellulosivorans TaxID=2932249 RepID=A0ABY4FC08_9BACT|nr:autotransporter outer membrane beta-barrel domain-containing protein [Hymenobacter cellulosivorans]UOQ54205.1 autotransporter outer membrane beta-barrel domain-containing protein [Hymenobacter cellulosivorans]
MNKCICVAALLLGGSALSAQAQTKAGTVLLGGGLGASKSKAEYTASYQSQTGHSESTSFSLSPRAGYFLADNLVLGLITAYNHSRSESEGFDNVGIKNTYTTKGNGYQLGPFVRYYKMLGEKAGFFGQLEAGYSRSSGESEDNNASLSTRKNRGYYGLLTPGFAYFPTPKLGLEITLGNVGYSKNTTVATDSFQQEPIRTTETTESGLGASFSLGSLAIGAAFYLGR